MLFLFYSFAILIARFDLCSAVWGVDVTFTSECEEALYVDIPQAAYGSFTLEPGDEYTAVLCEDACTGFLGMSKEYEYSWIASAADSSCSFSSTGSGSLSVSGFDLGGVNGYVTLACSDLSCLSSDAIDDVYPVHDEVDVDEMIYEDEDVDVGRYNGESDDGGFDNGYTANCGTVADNGGPSKSSGMAGVLARLSNAVYEDSETFKARSRALMGDSLQFTDFINAPYDTQVGIVATEKSIIIVFRGTQEDLDKAQDGKNSLVPVQLGGQSMTVHQGFVESYYGAKDQVNTWLSEYQGRQIFFAGHSLGAALAQIAALDISRRANTYVFAPPPIGDQGWVNAMSSSGVRDRTICFISPDDPIPFLSELVMANNFAAILAGALEMLGMAADASAVHDLRHGCRTVMVTSTSCEESPLVYNEDGSLGVASTAMSAHTMLAYRRLVVGQCVDASSGYPSCLSTGDVGDVYDENNAYDAGYDDGYDESYVDNSSNASYPSYDELEKFNLEMDWNPSSCYGDDECKTTKMVRAFTFSELTAKLVDRSENNTRCWDPKGSEAKTLIVGDQVSKETRDALRCIAENAAGSNEDLWHDIYVNVGSCTGLTPWVYFDLVVKLYTSIGLNRIAEDYGIGETVDRDSFLDYVNERIGRKVWIECDPDTRILRNVVVCIDPNDPFLIQDCTMDRNDPTSTNGIPCRGELKLPQTTSRGISDMDACEAYLLTDPAPALYGAQTKTVSASEYSHSLWAAASVVLLAL